MKRFTLFLVLFGLVSPLAAAKDSACEHILNTGHPVTVVVNAIDGERPRDLNDLFGVPVVFVHGPAPAEPRKLPGTVIHIGASRELARHVVGDKNPMVIDPSSGVEDNKWAEYQMIRGVDPTAIPESINGSELAAKPEGRAIPGQAEATRMVREFFERARQQFPEGAFVKHSAEAGTADDGGLIMTFKTKPEDIALKFAREMKAISKRKLHALLAGGELDKETLDSLSSYSRFVLGLALDPARIFVQRKVEIQKTSDGYNKEIRVDFVAGRAVNAHNRWSLEYIPAELQKAVDFVNRFFDKAPPHVRALSGGADVIFLAGGSLVFMELNVGSQSAYMDARDLILPGNLLVSKIKGYPTPLIERLERAHRMDFRGQMEFLRGLKVRNAHYDYHRHLGDLHLYDALVYLRNRAIDDLPRPADARSKRHVMDLISGLTASQMHRVRDDEVKKELEKFLAATGKSLELL